MFACENSNVDVVQLLLSDTRCDTNLTDNVIIITLYHLLLCVLLCDLLYRMARQLTM